MLRQLQERELGFVPPGRYASSERRRRARAMELSKRKDVISLIQSSINCLQIDPVERRYLLAGAANASVAAYDLEQPTRVETSVEEHEPVFCVDRLSPGGHKFSVSSVHWYPVDTGMFMTGSFDEFVNVWDTNTLETYVGFKLPGKVHSISMSPVAGSHMLIAAGTDDCQVRLCDIGTGAFTHTLTGHREGVWSVKWSASSEWILVTGGCEGDIRLWDIRRAGCFFVLDQHRSKISQGSSEQEPERHHPGLASVSDRATAHYGAVTALETTPDGHFLLSAGADLKVKLWDLNTGCNTLVNYGTPSIQRHKHIELAVSMEAPLVFVPSGSCIQAYDLWSGKLFSNLRGHLESVNCCTYDADTQRLYSGGSDRQILSWATETPRSDDKPDTKIAAPAVRPDEDNWSD